MGPFLFILLLHLFTALTFSNCALTTILYCKDRVSGLYFLLTLTGSVMGVFTGFWALAQWYYLV